MQMINPLGLKLANRTNWLIAMVKDLNMSDTVLLSKEHHV